jgi:hypothetical protein
MIPIYEQGRGRGIGYTLDSFVDRFDAICREHVEGKRAKAFAFIFYDFRDQDIRQVIKDQGVFTKLDRLAGTNLSIFYLNMGRKNTITKFNDEFLSKLEVTDKARPPCVVFFKLEKDRIEDVAVAQLDNANLLHGFHELYGVIERFIETVMNESAIGLRSLKWLRSGGRFIALEVFRAVLKKALDLVF